MTRRSKREIERGLEDMTDSVAHGGLDDADLFRVYFGLADGDVDPAEYGTTAREARREMHDRFLSTSGGDR